MSIWPRRTPCRAQVGSAWCRLCQVSPKDRIASGQKLAARSRRRTALADHVADRVDRPGDVVQQRDADQPGPEERGQRAPPGPGDQAAEQRRAATSVITRPQREQLVDPADVAVGEQVGGEPPLVGAGRGRTASPCGRARSPWPARGDGAEQPRRVRVALPVGEGVVAAVVGHPVDDGALHGQLPATASAIRSGRLALNEPWVK